MSYLGKQLNTQQKYDIVNKTYLGRESIMVNDFVILDGVLIEYTGSGSDIHIPDGVTKIDEFVFAHIDEITSVTIPDSVTSIDASAFIGCKGLADQNGFVIINGTLFDYFGDETDITIPDGVTRIADFVFEYHDLSNITIPDGVTSIGFHSFMGCDNLTSVTLPDSITYIDFGAFSKCDNLTQVILPNGNIHIEDEAFRKSPGLADENGFIIVNGILFDYIGSNPVVTIPDGVTRISSCAFACREHITHVTIPDSVTTIGEGAFCGCPGLADENGFVVIKGVLYDCFEYYATTIQIPDGVTHIDTTVFEDWDDITDVILPDSLTSIGYHAFDYCEKLTHINISENVTSFGELVFYGCKGLADNDGFVIAGGTLFDYFGNDTIIDIPNSITHIDVSAFSQCENITTITIPESVTRIGASAFCLCTALTSITIPESVTSIGPDAFAECENLTVHAPAGSYAQRYAKAYGIPFVAI